MEEIVAQVPWLEYIVKIGPYYSELRNASTALHKAYGRKRSKKYIRKNSPYRLTYLDFLMRIYL